MKKCWKRWKWGRMPRNASQKWVNIERCKIDCGVRWCNWIPQKWKRAWKNSETVLQSHVPRNHGTERFQEYLRKDNLLLRPHVIGSQLDSGADPYSPVLVQLLQTFCFCTSPWKDWQPLHLRFWTCFLRSHLSVTSYARGLREGLMDGTSNWKVWI